MKVETEISTDMRSGNTHINGNGEGQEKQTSSEKEKVKCQANRRNKRGKDVKPITRRKKWQARKAEKINESECKMSDEEQSQGQDKTKSERSGNKSTRGQDEKYISKNKGKDYNYKSKVRAKAE